MESRCVDISIYEFQYKRNMQAKKCQHDMPVNVETDYAKNKDESEKDSRMILTLEVGEIKEKNQPFYFMIKLAGIFEWENMDAETAKKEICSEGCEILLSYARTYLYDIMEKSGMQGFVIPLIHFEQQS